LIDRKQVSSVKWLFIWGKNGAISGAFIGDFQKKMVAISLATCLISGVSQTNYVYLPDLNRCLLLLRFLERVPGFNRVQQGFRRNPTKVSLCEVQPNKSSLQHYWRQAWVLGGYQLVI
jgi:hypothetical protein